ncbi:hypothetical protein SSX86_020724 [Deinandra increscens subsp. villosa]|uniref:VQ domain-containing protein n=1 Tax=Deinandra increscens subsp. villosa TaxID=3103831 RepID=A0AAP0CT95_9ASTR
MSPKKLLNGPKPNPLKLNQQSHTVFKQQEIRKPVIIYTRSPKVIHTKPHDFMALVQKLTGHSAGSKKQKQKKTLEAADRLYDLNHDDDDDNNYGADHIPLFTPNNNNTSDYLFSPQRLLRLSDMLSSSSPNKSTTSLSPGSLVDFMNRLPEY